MMESITKTNVVHVKSDSQRSGKTTIVVAGCAMILTMDHPALLDSTHETKLLIVSRSVPQSQALRDDVMRLAKNTELNIQSASFDRLSESRIPTAYMAMIDGLSEPEIEQAVRMLDGLVSYIYVTH